MIEADYFKSCENKLSYLYEVPAEKVKKTGIIFVHAAYGNKLGPHRMFVEFARKFNTLGYPTFRFDLAGCGDSTGNVLPNDSTGDVVDVLEAINFFMAKVSIKNVVLFGISRGARVCYAAAGQCKPVLGGIILLSTPMSGNRIAIKSLVTCLKEYFYKLKDINNLRKLLSGKVNLLRIWQTATTAFRIKRRYVSVGNKTLPGCPILFIYGGGDPTTGESSRFYSNECEENNLSYKCHIIPNANHSFFHYKWKEEIFDVSKQWLSEIRI